MRILGINAVFHDPSAAIVVDGRVIAASEEERFSRRKHGKRPVAFSAWELPEQSAQWCLAEAGITAADVDVVTYSFDPADAQEACALGLNDPWDHLRLEYARRAPEFIATAMPGLAPDRVTFVNHHRAHAASAGLAIPDSDASVLVVDGRGESASHLAGRFRARKLEVLTQQALPHSLGFLYESVTEHLGFLRSSDEYKVMAMASYGRPRFLDDLRRVVHATGDGGFRAPAVDWSQFAPALDRGDAWQPVHADLAASVQAVLEEVLVDLASWLHGRTGDRVLAMAGGVALNCVANSRILERSGFERLCIQPAASDAGTALGGALYAAEALGDNPRAALDPVLGRGWDDEELELALVTAQLAYTRPDDIAEHVAEALARNEIVAWFQGRSETGPRALGHRSLLAHPGFPANLHRLNDVKGREQFRPVAPMVLLDAAPSIFTRGPIPSPHMLFVHDVVPEWRDRIPAVIHVDGTARIQTVDPREEPLVARMLTSFQRISGLPVVVNTSLNTAGRPMVDDPRDAFECFGSAPIDLLAIGPFAVRRCGSPSPGGAHG